MHARVVISRFWVENVSNEILNNNYEMLKLIALTVIILFLASIIILMLHRIYSSMRLRHHLSEQETAYRRSQRAITRDSIESLRQSILRQEQQRLNIAWRDLYKPE